MYGIFIATLVATPIPTATSSSGASVFAPRLVANTLMNFIDFNLRIQLIEVRRSIKSPSPIPLVYIFVEDSGQYLCRCYVVMKHYSHPH